jgi:hypothetical protein
VKLHRHWTVYLRFMHRVGKAYKTNKPHRVVRLHQMKYLGLFHPA